MNYDGISDNSTTKTNKLTEKGSIKETVGVRLTKFNDKTVQVIVKKGTLQIIQQL